MAFITNTIVGLILAKLHAIPTGTNTSKTLTQELNKILLKVRENLLKVGPFFGSAGEAEAGISGGATSRASGIDAEETSLFTGCRLAVVAEVIVTMVGRSLDLPVCAQE